MAPLAHAASIWASPGSWNIELTQGNISRKELPGRAGRKSPQSYEHSLGAGLGEMDRPRS